MAATVSIDDNSRLPENVLELEGDDFNNFDKYSYCNFKPKSCWNISKISLVCKNIKTESISYILSTSVNNAPLILF
ncbi:unnamed protein product, partial [Rotaria sordida]